MQKVKEGQVGFLCIDGTHADIISIAAAKYKHGNFNIYRTTSPRIFFMDTSECSKSPEQIVESILNKRNPIHGKLSLIPVDYTATARAKDLINAAKRSLENNEVLKDAVQFTFLPYFHDFNRHKMPGDHLSVSLKGAVDIVYPKAFLLRRNYFAILISLAVGDVYTIGIVNKTSSPKTMESIVRHMEQNFEVFKPLVNENINKVKLGNGAFLNQNANEKHELEENCGGEHDEIKNVGKDCEPETSIFFTSIENEMKHQMHLGDSDESDRLINAGNSHSTSHQIFEQSTKSNVASFNNEVVNEMKEAEMEHVESEVPNSFPKPEKQSTSAELRQLLSEQNAKIIFCPFCKTKIAEITIVN